MTSIPYDPGSVQFAALRDSVRVGVAPANREQRGARSYSATRPFLAHRPHYRIALALGALVKRARVGPGERPQNLIGCRETHTVSARKGVQFQRTL